MTTGVGPAESARWVAARAPLPGVDPLAGAQLWGEPEVFWERPLACEAVAGWGVAATMEAASLGRMPHVLRALSSPDAMRWLDGPPQALPGPWFGGMRFAARGDDAAWEPFGFGRWTLPELLVWREGSRLMGATFAPEGPGAEDRVRSRLARAGAAFPPGYHEPRHAARQLRLSSSRRDFEHKVAHAVERIHAGHFQKVVLARAVEVEAEQPFDQVNVLARLREHNPRCATFLFRAPDRTAFLGATPETLCRLEGRRLETEALAGTASLAQAEGLMASDKDRREHQAVVGDILRALKPLAERLDVDAEPALLPLRNVVHLRTGIRAVLHEGVGVAELVSALHPTPAVGGSPREHALAFLAEHEALDRGWYAGPVGWVGPGKTHQMVALRSARVKGARARLFVGAGIVAGSTAESEWRETEFKSLAMLRALGEEHG